jgi:hypothetical protein
MQSREHALFPINRGVVMGFKPTNTGDASFTSSIFPQPTQLPYAQDQPNNKKYGYHYTGEAREDNDWLSMEGWSGGKSQITQITTTGQEPQEYPSTVSTQDNLHHTCRANLKVDNETPTLLADESDKLIDCQETLINLNKSPDAHLDLINNISGKKWDIVLIQGPNITFFTNIRTLNHFVSINPSSHFTLQDTV